MYYDRISLWVLLQIQIILGNFTEKFQMAEKLTLYHTVHDNYRPKSKRLIIIDQNFTKSPKYRIFRILLKLPIMPAFASSGLKIKRFGSFPEMN